MKKKDIILFASIFCILSLILGSTYAYWSWQSGTNKSVIFNTSKSIAEYITYDEGESHFVGDFQPSSNYCGGMSNTISFSKTSEASDVDLVATINMDVNYIGTDTKAATNVKWVLVSGNSTVCSGSVSSGTFNGINSGSTIKLAENIEITEATKTYTIWIWIDNSVTNSLISGETIDVNIWSQIDMLDTSPDA